MVLSDTQNFIQSMLATRKPIAHSSALFHYLIKRSLEANHHVEEGQISKGSFLRLTSYQANRVKDKRCGLSPIAENNSVKLCEGY